MNSSGVAVCDVNGTPMASVRSVESGQVLLAVGDVRAQLPVSNFRIGPRGPQIAIGADELRARIEAQRPKPAVPAVQ